MVLSKLIKREIIPERDKVVILESDGTADIATVIDKDDERLFAVADDGQEYSIPIANTKSFVSSRGRIFYVGAEPEYSAEMKRIAKLERSVVLRQITNYYDDPGEDKKQIQLREIILYILIVILIIGVIVK